MSIMETLKFGGVVSNHGSELFCGGSQASQMTEFSISYEFDFPDK